MNTTLEKFIELLKNNEFEHTDLTVDEAKELIAEKYPFIPKYDLSIFMASFDKNDKLIVINGYSTIGDDCSFVLYKKYN